MGWRFVSSYPVYQGFLIDPHGKAANAKFLTPEAARGIAAMRPSHATSGP